MSTHEITAAWAEKVREIEALDLPLMQRIRLLETALLTAMLTAAQQEQTT